MGDQDQKPTPENVTMLQAFEWFCPDDGKHWQRLKDAVTGLKATGIDNIWVPPGCKGSSPQSNGYDIYDLYDLGEFDTKGGKATKWGTKEELLQLSQKANDVGVGLYWDAVLNHKASADYKEKCMAVEVDPEDRTKTISEPEQIDAWLGFDFPARGDKYSTQKYHWYHFSGTDFNAANNKSAIYKILGDNKDWSHSVDQEKGNYDFLMFADLSYEHPEVKEDVNNWGVWISKQLTIKGFRFDAVKHFSEDFLKEFLANFEKTYGLDGFYVGEFWEDSLEGLTAYLQRMGHKFSLFDVPLVMNFSKISKEENGDLTKVFEGTLVKVEPVNAVTLVLNHDIQAYRDIALPLDDWFKPLAYSLICLRYDGYPCLFYGDLYGTKGEHPLPPACSGKLPDIALARKLYAYGEQEDYLDFQTCIGWVRRGTHDRPSGLACVMSNAGPNEKNMYVGTEHKGEVWTDVLGWESSEVTIGEDGKGMFTCPGTSVAIWVNKEAKGRDRFGKFDANIYKE